MKEVKTNNINQYIKDNNIKKDTIIFNTNKNIGGALFFEEDYHQDELMISIICSLVGFLDRINIKANCNQSNQIISEDIVIGNVTIKNKYIFFDIDLADYNALQTQIGLKTFINIYINLLQKNQYNKTYEYYRDILVK